MAEESLRWPELALTLDEISDYHLLKTIIETIAIDNPYFGCLDTIKFLNRNPELLQINQHVKRKGAT